MTDALRKFAKELKSFRESKEISLNYIATRTKIDIKFLQAIEEGNFEILPDLYIRAFLKEYAQVADFDVPEVMKKFDQAKKGLVEEKSNRDKEVAGKESTKNEETENGIIDQDEPKNIPPQDQSIIESSGNREQSQIDKFLTRKNQYNYYLLSMAAIVVIGILIYFLIIRESSTQIIYESSNDELVDNPDKRFEIESSSDEISSVPPDDSIKIDLNASARVWVKVLADNKEVFQSFLNENQNMSFKAMNEFKISVGNAGFISMQLNNRTLTLPGTRGEVRNYTINADTIKSFLLSVPSKNENRSRNQN